MHKSIYVIDVLIATDDARRAVKETRKLLMLFNDRKPFGLSAPRYYHFDALRVSD